MMRVLHITWSAEFGGIERLVHDMAVEQRRNGAEVSVLFGRAVGGLLPRFKESGIECLSAGLSNGYDCDPRKILRIRALLKRFDLIHVHTFVLPLALAVGLARRPVVYTEHGNFGFGRKLGPADHIKRPLYRVFLRSSVRHLTFNSAFTRGIWEERSPVRNLARSVIPNGIPFNGEVDAPPPPPEDLRAALPEPFIVGTTSRFAGFKRVDRLIRGFAKFLPGRRARLLLVGDGPLRPQLEALVGQLGLRDATHFTGFRQDARACQSFMNVCVFPSQNEPFGLVAVETLALGKPTIVFADGGGIADIVRDVAPENVVASEDALVDRLVFYHENPNAPASERDRLIAHSRRYDIRTTAARFRDLYQSLIPS